MTSNISGENSLEQPENVENLFANSAVPDGESSTPDLMASTVADATADATHTSGVQSAAASKPTTRKSFDFSSLPDLRDNASREDAPEEDDSNTSEHNSHAQNGRSREEFTTVYDIIDGLEESIENAKSTLFSPGTVKIDRISFSDQLDTLKTMLPVQLERASALMREAERRLENAQTQANAIISSAQSRSAEMIKDAQEQAQFLAGQENVTDLARQKARAILDQAQTKSDRLTQGADQYCTNVMQELQQQLDKLSQDVHAGLNVLTERQKSAGEHLPHVDISDYPEG